MAETIQWEYRVECIGSLFGGPKDADLQQMLDEWGAEGWEVFSAVPETNSYKIRLIAKRPMTSNSRRKRTWPTA